MKRFTLSLMMLLMVAMTFAQTTFTWTAANAGFDDQEEVADFDIATDLSALAEKNGGNNEPKYYDNGKSVRLYASNTLTLQGPGITRIAFTFTGGKNSLTANVGAIADDVWTGEATDELVLTVPTGQARIASMEITYAGDGEAVEAEDERDVEDILVEVPDGLETEEWALEGYYVYGDGDDDYDKIANTLNVGIQGEDVYIQGLSYNLPDAWVKGHLNADRTAITIPSPQYYGTVTYDNYEYPSYLVFNVYDEDQNIDDYPESLTLNYDAETGVLDVDNTVYLLENATPVREWNTYGYYLQMSVHKGAPEVATEIELPEGVDPAEYHFAGFDLYYEKDSERAMQVAFDGTDVYFQGLSEAVPEGWVKGTLADGVVTVPEGQYMGLYTSFFGDAEIYFGGAEFAYDAENGTFTAADGYVTTADGYVWDEFSNVVISRVVDQAATPATPSVVNLDYDEDWSYSVYLDIPLTGVDGTFLLSSKLGYRLYAEIDGQTVPYEFKTTDYEYLPEDMTVVPYTFTDEWDIASAGYLVYLYGDVDTWTKIGVQSVYTGGNETRESDISWYTIETEGISDVTTEGQTVLYDLQGRRADSNTRGLLIRVEKRADGTVRSTKVVR